MTGRDPATPAPRRDFEALLERYPDFEASLAVLLDELRRLERENTAMRGMTQRWRAERDAAVARTRVVTDALEWVYAEPEDPAVVQERARAALVVVDEPGMSFDPSPARRGFDALLARYPHFDVLYVERGSAETEALRRAGALGVSLSAPWIIVTLGQPSEGGIEAFARWEFAIWKNTGAVYTVKDGAVSEDPIIEVKGMSDENVDREGPG